jgi:Flagellar biosynthesis protein, FliO
MKTMPGVHGVLPLVQSGEFVTEIRCGRLARWLIDKLRREPKPRPRLSLVERIPLAPRQSLVLIEAEGRRFLVATSQEGSPSFYPLDSGPEPGTFRRTGVGQQAGRSR